MPAAVRRSPKCRCLRRLGRAQPSRAGYHSPSLSFPTQVLPEEARRRVTSTLLLDPRTALVLRHEDAWEPPHAAPRLPRALRRLNCACSNAVYRLLGWEAELRAAQAAAPSWDA